MLMEVKKCRGLRRGGGLSKGFYALVGAEQQHVRRAAGEQAVGDDAGEMVELTPREFGLLHLLLQNPGRVVTRRTLEEQLYTWNDAVDSNALEVHIHHLRKKLGGDLIRTVRGVGYLASAAPRP